MRGDRRAAPAASARLVAAVAAALALIIAPAKHFGKEPRPARYDRLAPTAPLATADLPVAEQLRAFLGEKLGHFINGSRDRADVAAFYRLRGFAPLWIENGTASARARAASLYLATVDNEALEPSDYAPIEIGEPGDAAALAAAELKFTATILIYARDAQNGRIPFALIGPDIDYPRKISSARDILTRVGDASDAATALASFNPPQQEYRALRAKLAQLRGRKLEDVSEDARTFAADAPGSHFRPGVVRPAAPQEFDQVDIITANMERWRWLPRDLGPDYVLVNIPDYTLTLMRRGVPYFRTSVVVGAPQWSTPLISAAMQSITVNPIWNVPPSIIPEYTAALARDPGLAARMGLKVESGAAGNVKISQPPGDQSVLGRLRFNFPNKFLVFQHDTNEKFLFAAAQRDVDHGCIRVANPFYYAAALLSIALPDGGYSEERLRGMVADHEINIVFPAPIPVHLTYQTAFVDDDGDLAARADIYGLDARVLAALKAPRIPAAGDTASAIAAARELTQANTRSP